MHILYCAKMTHCYAQYSSARPPAALPGNNRKVWRTQCVQCSLLFNSFLHSFSHQSLPFPCLPESIFDSLSVHIMSCVYWRPNVLFKNLHVRVLWYNRLTFSLFKHLLTETIISWPYYKQKNVWNVPLHFVSIVTIFILFYNCRLLHVLSNRLFISRGINQKIFWLMKSVSFLTRGGQRCSRH